ncbi:MAG: hypothetical protein ACTFAL_15385 [Candidatus Electronema sp. V4]|uniref:hypothetical protein n=1 Tax=Candidatus Electronema sp. V4 TaxID=3454756 RepID=UPI0040555506
MSVKKNTPILKVNQPNDSKERDVIINRETAISIAQQVSMQPMHAAVFGQINKEKYIAAPFEEIVIFRQAGSIWKKELSFPCDSSCNGYGYPKWEFTEIENKPFLFVKSDEIGNAGGTVNLSLFSFEEKKAYILSISGNYREEETKDDTISYLEGPYIIEKNYDQLEYKDISKHLEDKIEKSGWFPKQTDEDVDMSNPKNAEKNG